MQLYFQLHFPFLRGAYLEFTRHDELRGVHADHGVHATEQKNGQDDGEVTDELPHLDGGEDGRRTAR